MNTRKTHSFRTDAAGNIVIQESVHGPAAWSSTVISPSIGGLPEAQARCSAGYRRYLKSDFAGALADYEGAASIAEAAYGRDHAVTGHYLSQVGVMLKVLGRNEEALATHLEVLRIRDANMPPNAPEIASSCNNVAVALEALGRADETERFYSRAIRIEEAAFGRSGDPTLATRLNQVSTLYLDGHFREAAGLITGIVDDVARRHADGGMTNRPLVLECLQMLLKAYRAAGRQTFRGRHEALLREYGLA